MTAWQLRHILLEAESRVFASAVLLPSSRALLLQKVPPVHARVIAHHMTIAFNPDTEQLVHFPLRKGQRVRLRVVGVAVDRKAQAVAVQGYSLNAHPHITISCADGVPAKYSNELLAKRRMTRVQPFTLTAVVRFEALAAPV